MIDFGFSEDAELQKLSAQVAADPEEFEHWEKLVRAAEAQEGGLNRNSSPQAIASTREAYDRFLARYPLFYGFWKRYADMEFAIAGPEAAEMVYERGVASIGISVDLWTNYCGFKAETNHEPDMIRDTNKPNPLWRTSYVKRGRDTLALPHAALAFLLEPAFIRTATAHTLPLRNQACPSSKCASFCNMLFERGAESCGQDFLAHPFWDKYIEFEERLDDKDHIFDILSKVIRLPLHQYSRYFERYNNMSKEQPIEKLASANVIASLRSEIEQTVGNNPAEVEREMRTRVEAMHWEIFTGTQTEVTKRWTYESVIKRPYYHVTELDDEQLTNWGKYLDYEEAEGDYGRIKFLYERCLVTAANYDEIWFRYARWLAAQEGKQEEVRNAYQRASSVFIAIAKPAIRLQYANFEESQGRSDVAVAIHEAILMHIPSHLETIKSLVNLHRRQYGVDSAVEVLRKYSEDGDCTQQTRGALVAEWARILWRSRDDSAGARELFESTQNQFLDSQPFWSSWLLFEIEQPATQSQESAAHKRIRGVHQLIRHKSTLPPELIKVLSSQYTRYLEERGGKDAMSELLKLDAELNGPVSVQAAAKAKA